MICAGCAHENRAEARFCDACGAPLAVACTSCGVALRVGARFCDGCGAAVAGAAPAALPALPSFRTDPRSYTPKHLADKILQSKSALEGERKQVTVGSLGHQASVCRVRAKLARALIAPGVYIARFRSRRACRLPDSRRCSVRERRERVQS